jgi:hypothetical protein
MIGEHQQRFCENCGAELSAGVRFCTQCGEALWGGNPVAGSDTGSPGADESSPSPPVSATPVSRPLKMAGVSALAGAATVLLAGGAWWWWTHRNNQFQPAAPPIPEISSVPAEPLPPEPAPPPAPENPEVVAAQDLADMFLWLGKQPWVIALSRSMPKGVTVSAHAEPYNAEGWSDVQFRENHAPESGFDPDVSPSVGIFRISRKDRTVQWLEPVSGEYLPLSEFIKSRETGSPLEPPVLPGLVGGDFETKPQPVPGYGDAVIVPDPENSANQVARITGPEEMGFALPCALPAGASEVTVSLRLLHPLATKLLRFDDGQEPEGIRLRVRLINAVGNSAIRDAVVRPTGLWRKMEFTFYDPPSEVVAVGIEAIWMEGPVYVDDVKARHLGEGGAK